MILLDFLGLKNELLAIYTLQCFAIALIWKMVHRIVQHCIMKLSALHRSTPYYTWITFYNITLQYIAMPFAQDVGPVLYETESIALNCTLIPCSRLQSIACYCNAEDVGRSTPGSWELPATTPPTSTNSRRTSCKYQYVYFIQIPI